MNIVITGARGFIGHSLHKYLLQKGYEVIGLGRLDDSGIYGRFEIETNHILNEGKSLSDYCINSEVIVHLAAQKIDNIDAPLADYLSSNITLTEDVCRAANPNCLKKLIFSSSRLVYSDNIGTNLQEDYHINPSNTYGLSKKIAEDIVNFYSIKNQWTGISLRLGQVYDSDLNQSGAVSRFILQAINKGYVTVFGEGVAVRDFVYLQDVLLAFESAIVGDVPSGAYNIGSGCGYSVKEIALTVSEVFLDSDSSVRYIPVDSEDKSRYVMDCNKALQYLKWQPKWKLEQTIKHIYNRYNT